MRENRQDKPGDPMRKALAVVALLCLPASFAIAEEHHQRFVTFDAPGANSTAQAATYPLHGTTVVDVNDRGEIVGYFNNDANTVIQAFVRYPDGRIVVSDDPGAGTAPGPLALQVGTMPNAINDAGITVGSSMTQNGYNIAFVRSAHDTFTDFTGPQSLPGFNPPTRAMSINNRGQITGDYLDYPTGYRAYIRNSDGTMTSFDAPDASFSGFWNGTTATSINAHGDVCGFYHDANGAIHSFLRLHDGHIIDFDVPGASTAAYAGAFASRITDEGVVLGFYQDQNWQTFGYIRYPNGQVSTVSIPQIPDGHAFVVTNINHRGDVLGSYLDANSVTRAFLLTRTGRLFRIDAPKAGTAPSQGTIAVNLNEEEIVAGYFIDANNVSHGFLWSAHD